MLVVPSVALRLLAWTLLALFAQAAGVGTLRGVAVSEATGLPLGDHRFSLTLPALPGARARTVRVLTDRDGLFEVQRTLGGRVRVSGERDYPAPHRSSVDVLVGTQAPECIAFRAGPAVELFLTGAVPLRLQGLRCRLYLPDSAYCLANVPVRVRRDRSVWAQLPRPRTQAATDTWPADPLALPDGTPLVLAVTDEAGLVHGAVPLRWDRRRAALDLTVPMEATGAFGLAVEREPVPGFEWTVGDRTFGHGTHVNARSVALSGPKLEPWRVLKWLPAGDYEVTVNSRIHADTVFVAAIFEGQRRSVPVELRLPERSRTVRGSIRALGGEKLVLTRVHVTLPGSLLRLWTAEWAGHCLSGVDHAFDRERRGGESVWTFELVHVPFGELVVDALASDGVASEVRILELEDGDAEVEIVQRRL